MRGGNGAHAVRFSSQFFYAANRGKSLFEEETVVQIIFDEIKVKCGVAYNPMTGEESGFIANINGIAMNFAVEILSIAKESVVPTTSANVLKLRTSKNQT